MSRNASSTLQSYEETTSFTSHRRFGVKQYEQGHTIDGEETQENAHSLQAVRQEVVSYKEEEMRSLRFRFLHKDENLQMGQGALMHERSFWRREQGQLQKATLLRC